ncbi:gliding motility lipoprotein GldH [Arcticibacter svalbardensis]|uniref:gliding motility lipoprotein GldH n=1 Tax=Arcticibacter svalbardensis TaxID=1288027 RepID=UPI0005917E99|nr:gliding motility lipoprotein GldH [Arcticibacter svalbardensis]
MQNKGWRLYAVLIFICLSGLQGCEENAVVDVNTSMDNGSWGYDKKINVPVQITDASKLYNLYFNLRHTSNYQYSNIFVLIHQKAKGLKTITERKEFKLAYPDGEWLGSGTGNFYSYQLPFRKDYKFPSAGTYVFEIEQNMRDNPLKEIIDVGLRVEPVAAN